MVGGIFFLEGKQSEARQTRSYEYAETAKDNAIIRCQEKLPFAVADCIYDEIKSSQQQAQGEQDLDAQQWMARWAMILTFITAATTLISWIALRYLRNTFRQTAKGALAAAQATEAMVQANKIANEQVQPYLMIRSVHFRVLKNIRTYPYAVQYYVEIENSGQSPARDVFLQIDCLSTIDSTAIALVTDDAALNRTHGYCDIGGGGIAPIKAVCGDHIESEEAVAALTQGQLRLILSLKLSYWGSDDEKRSVEKNYISDLVPTDEGATVQAWSFMNSARDAKGMLPFLLKQKMYIGTRSDELPPWPETDEGQEG